MPASGPGPLAGQRTFTAWSDIRGTGGHVTGLLCQGLEETDIKDRTGVSWVV